MDETPDIDLSVLSCEQPNEVPIDSLQSVTTDGLPRYSSSFHTDLQVVQPSSIVQPAETTLDQIIFANHPTPLSVQPPQYSTSCIQIHEADPSESKPENGTRLPALPSHLPVLSTSSHDDPINSSSRVTIIDNLLIHRSKPPHDTSGHSGFSQPNLSNLSNHLTQNVFASQQIERAQPQFSSCTDNGIFTDKVIWCEECEKSHSSECETHPPINVPDREIPTHAVLTLPSFLTLNESSEERCVIAKRSIKKRTRFGPVKGKLVDTIDDNIQHFKIFTSKTNFKYIDMSDETVSNWLMFVRPANSYSDQNLVIYQHNGLIYYLVSKFIQPGQELKYGYCTSYAHLLNVQTFKEITLSAIPVEKKVVIKDGYPCDLCSEDFDTYEKLDAHKCAAEPANQKGVKRTKNKRKGKPQKLPSSSKTGASVKKSQTSILNKKRETLTCGFCGQNFNTSNKLGLHIYSHTGKLPFNCESGNCEKAFDSKFKLYRHQLIHDSKKFMCVDCGKNFTRKDHLKNHLITHDDNRRIFRCDFESCQKSYSTNLAFKAHLAFHQADHGSLQCAICTKLFENKDALVKHIKVHSGSKVFNDKVEKAHLCDMCNKNFYTQKDLKRHIVTHTKEKNYECIICFQRFGRRDHLTRHSRRHGNDHKPKSQSTEQTRLNLELSKSIQQILTETNLDVEPTSIAVGSQVINTSSQSSVHITNIIPTNICTVYKQNTATDRAEQPELRNQSMIFPGSDKSTSYSQPYNQLSDKNSELHIMNLNWPLMEPQKIIVSGEQRVPNSSTMLLLPESNEQNKNSSGMLINELNDDSTTEYNDTMKVYGTLGGTLGGLLNTGTNSTDSDLSAFFIPISQTSSSYR